MTYQPDRDQPYGPGASPPPLPTRGTGAPEVVPAQPVIRPYQQAQSPAVQEPNQQVVGFFGDIVRTGRWQPAAKTTATQIFGDLKFDLRQVLAPGQTLEIESWSLFGDVRVLVPPGTTVEVKGGALMGDVRTETDPREDAVRPSEPGAHLVVTCYSIFGDVRVREAGPDVGKPPKGWRWAKKGI